MCILLTTVQVHIVCKCPQRPEKDVGYPGAGVASSSKPNLGPLQEQQVSTLNHWATS